MFKLAPLRDFLFLYKVGKELLIFFVCVRVLSFIAAAIILVLLFKYSASIPSNPKYKPSNGVFPVEMLPKHPTIQPSPHHTKDNTNGR
jgi:hypothetical protein